MAKKTTKSSVSKTAASKTAAKKTTVRKAVVKTTQNNSNAEDFINSVKEEQKRKDSFVLLELMKKATGEKPKMWGTSLIGFGFKTITSPSGRVVDWFDLGFSPRKANISIYFMGFDMHKESLKKLGKYKTGSGCLYINKLEDVDLKVLKKMIEDTVKAKKD